MYIKNKKDLEDFLNIESNNYGIKNRKYPLIAIRENDILWKYTYILRKTEYFVNTNKKIRGIIYKVILFNLQNRYALRIPINTFDCGLKIMHLGPILVNGKVKAGKNIVLHTGISIVAGGTNDYVPKIGDGVLIGVGAILLGNIYLANNIAVGANSVVNKSFYEENICIAGVPAKKISDNGRLSWGKSKLD